MSNETSTASFPFLSILCLIFITLKLTGFIVWSWWMVLSPIWIPFAVAVAILGVMGIVYLICKK